MPYILTTAPSIKYLRREEFLEIIVGSDFPIFSGFGGGRCCIASQTGKQRDVLEMHGDAAIQNRVVPKYLFMLAYKLNHGVYF